ncbi:MAG: EAL domain-containing protein [Solirubrobacteraceae bacterium]|nr:EAL domain-containing protein [Solirubrobacteraceae bacterium]
MPSVLGSIRAWLPEGSSLPGDQWAARHRALTAILVAHIPVFLIWGVLEGFPLPHAVLDVVPLVIAAWLARNDKLTRRGREVAVALGLLSASAILIHLMHGAVEAHFHFFIMVSLLALYEAWFPYLLAFAYVLVHHGLMSLASSASVFNHADAIEHPLKWSLIHAIFIGAQALICLVGWKMNEVSRREAIASQERFARAFNHAPTGMALVDLGGRILEVNDALQDRWNRSTTEPLVGRSVRALVDASQIDGAFPGDTAMDLPHADHTGWGHWRHAPMFDEHGARTGWVTHCLDITRRRALESDLQWQAHHDPLTDLPNREAALERLQASIARGRDLAVVFLDVDEFKTVNDSLGHGAGDDLLKTVAARLLQSTGDRDRVARFGGDEFVVLLDGIASEATARVAIDRIAETLRQPIEIAGQEVYASTSIGVRICVAGEALTGDEALRDADAAMYRAKGLGKGRCEFFDDAMRDQALQRLELESALHSVLERDELALVYQPLVDLATGQITGVEALLRWHHPVVGFVSPADFIPLAEQNGTIIEIGAWVIEEACRQGAEWDRPDLKISVNVASRQLADARLVDVVRSALKQTGLEPGQLCLEITETAALGDHEATSRSLADLKDLGVALAVDDFGVGYASLSHLRQLLPVDTLKIDKSFIDGLLIGDEDAAIVEGVIRLAHSLGLDVVAEGIEHREQADRLADWGCETGQGYHFARPLPPAEITARLTPTAPGPVAQLRAA